MSVCVCVGVGVSVCGLGGWVQTTATIPPTTHRHQPTTRNEAYVKATLGGTALAGVLNLDAGNAVARLDAALANYHVGDQRQVDALLRVRPGREHNGTKEEEEINRVSRR